MRIAIIFVFSIFCTLVSHAQWQQTNGLENKMIPSILATESDIYAATPDSGLFKYINKNASWVSANNGLTNSVINTIMISSSGLYTGTNAGLFFSSNNGNTWNSVSNVLANVHIISLATVGNSIFAGTDAGLFVSTDQGQNWKSDHSGLPNAAVNSLWATSGNLYAATDSGVFLLKDKSSTWLDLNNGLTSKDVKAITTADTNLYACTYSGGVFMSSINHLNWTAINDGLTNTHTWAIVGDGNPFVYVVAGGGGGGGGHGGGTGGGHGKGGVFMLKISTDNHTWVNISAGLTKNDARSIAITSTDLYAGTADGGVWKRSLSDINSGIDEAPLSSPAISIYPNPTTGNFYIDCPLSVQKIEVHDLAGKLLKYQNINHFFDLGSESAGCYFITVYTSVGTFSEKVFKN